VEEFRDFLYSIPSLSQEPSPILQEKGGKVLDNEDDQFDFDSDSDYSESPLTNSLNTQQPVDEKDDLILGPIRKSPPITGPVSLTYAVERFYMDVRDDFRITSRGRPYVEGAHSRYETLYKWLKRHAAVYGEIDLFQVTDKWLKDFIHYLHHQSLSLNTVSGYIDNLHAVFRNLASDGLALPKLTMRVSPEATNAIYNSEDELQTLLTTKYSHEALTNASEIFVMQSYLGFRVGTLQKFLRDPQLYLFRQKDSWLVQIRTNKTGFIVTVPVKPFILEILERRNYTFEPAYFERYYNTLIKLMAAEAGLTFPVGYSITYGNKCREFKDPKFELMSSHTARRNFATNAFLAKIPVVNIMWITGHTTIEAFFRYIRCDSLANALAMIEYDFFK